MESDASHLLSASVIGLNWNLRAEKFRPRQINNFSFRFVIAFRMFIVDHPQFPFLLQKQSKKCVKIIFPKKICFFFISVNLTLGVINLNKNLTRQRGCFESSMVSARQTADIAGLFITVVNERAVVACPVAAVALGRWREMIIVSTNEGKNTSRKRSTCDEINETHSDPLWAPIKCSNVLQVSPLINCSANFLSWVRTASSSGVNCVFNFVPKQSRPKRYSSRWKSDIACLETLASVNLSSSLSNHRSSPSNNPKRHSAACSCAAHRIPASVCQSSDSRPGTAVHG